MGFALCGQIGAAVGTHGCRRRSRRIHLGGGSDGQLVGLGEIELVYEYPLRLERRGFGLLERLTIARSRRIRSRPELPVVEVRPLPTEDRPQDFNGAIGPHVIAAVATPTEVPVGDPVTLSLTVRGAGPLDRLSAPRLDRVDALTEDFEVPAESLAGELTAGGKTFTLTIRAPGAMPSWPERSPAMMPAMWVP